MFAIIENLYAIFPGEEFEFIDMNLPTGNAVFLSFLRLHCNRRFVIFYLLVAPFFCYLCALCSNAEKPPRLFKSLKLFYVEDGELRILRFCCRNYVTYPWSQFEVHVQCNKCSVLIKSNNFEVVL